MRIFVARYLGGPLDGADEPICEPFPRERIVVDAAGNPAAYRYAGCIEGVAVYTALREQLTAVQF